MSELPSGTVTFLFTDVQGSTRLLREQGDRYAALLAAQRRVIRDAIAAHRGVEVDAQGDAVFAAFARAADAVAAAAGAQAALAGGPVAVRMGIHTGAPQVTDEGYVGIDVHRAARIAAAGHGGQVVLSRATRDLVDADVRDLGEHRLKDLGAPEHLFQLGNREFPPLTTIGRTNLPVPASAFLGRARELEEVGATLARDDVRLLTLTGPGGTGKTRLALQVAAEASDRYPDGVWWIALAAVRDPRLVADEVARILGAKRALAEHVGRRRMLLVLDNFEQVLGAAPEVGELIAACPRLDVLTTSREPLHVAGEWEFRVDPLDPEDAVAFFAQRARAVARDVELDGAVAEICRRLDRLPLALELAAARVKVLAPPALLERLRRNLPVLATGARDAPERQRTLEATIGWSHDLLGPAEQRLFARLAVFAGGCTLEAAEVVCDADLDTLASLVDKSLVRRRGERYWMLETIRQFASGRLEASGEAEALRARHAEWLAGIVEQAAPHVFSARGRVWVERLHGENDNLRAALAWALEEPVAELPWRLTGDAVWWMWFTHGAWAEGVRWLRATLALPAPADERLTLGALRGAAMLALWQEEDASVGPVLDRLETVAARLGDTRRLGAAAQLRGMMCSDAGDLAAARRHQERAVALARETGERWLESTSVNNIGDLLLLAGRVREAAARFEESLAIAREIDDPYLTALALSNLGQATLQSGDGRRAEALATEMLAIAREGPMLDHLAVGLLTIARLQLAANPDAAVRLVAAADEILTAAGGFHQPFEQRVRDEAVAVGRERLGAEAFDAAYAAGRALSLDAAVAEALASAGAPGATTRPAAR